jgi:endo-1,3(4)-beta-glucanase
VAEYEELLRERAHLYPGENADVRYGVNTTSGKAVVRLDWDVQDMTKQTQKQNRNTEEELIMYALPHHLSRMKGDKWMPWTESFCVSSLVGSTCAVTGSTWDLVEDLPISSFRAPRPPRVEALPEIASALQDDISYEIPANFQRGAGDTYFSGKILARVGRVLLINEELEDLCEGKAIGYDLTNEEKLAYMNTCRDLTLPTDEEITASLDMLRGAVEIWINGTGEARFAYDSGWGGVINCGCLWDDGTQGCSNSLPDCPATTDQGLNFGNGYYNDHHFHYGYHIYAAAALTHFDRDWGRRHFDDVLLLIRDFANPSDDDVYFPRFRHKDWYQGSSWASGITMPMFGNIVNQESTSEAIAAYEAVALYGREMVRIS